MTTKAENHERRSDSLSGWDVTITTYQIGETWYCHVDNVSPGATVSRASGVSKEVAESTALAKARDRLATTKKREV